MHKVILSICVLLAAMATYAADPTATHYPAADCQGSLKPYPAPEQSIAAPDSLKPVYISHVGRHGARYPASATHCMELKQVLESAQQQGSITPLGIKLSKLVDHVIETSHNRWGALDSLGMAEQRGIASRMFVTFPAPFTDGVVNAISSYSPRSMMSMFSFVHQLDRLNNHVEINTSTGRKNSALMRPFDVDQDYIAYIKGGTWKEAYDPYFKSTAPSAPIERVVGKGYNYGDKDPQNLSLTEYYVIAGLSAMSVEANALDYFTLDEYNALWSIFNLRQYLQRAATTQSSIPADIASQLLLNIITLTDEFIAGVNPATVDLRFGHAETLFPLLSLMRVQGSYYLTNYFDTVGQHWMDFQNVPMAANLQMILFKGGKKGDYYVRFDLNEHPIKLIPNDDRIYLPWIEARNYLVHCLPLFYQP
ncbi:MAG: hypothetical protein K2L93_07820 [Muribaculaceae bacterium]|nr:hypothetical protein [Muribaculaceae bacterium]